MIIFDNVTKTYGTHKVLDKVSFKIHGKEFVSIVGPAGAGKSTLINALIGATKIDEGSITIDGYEITTMRTTALQYYRRKLGVVFQDYQLLQQKTVYENVAFAMEACGKSDVEIKNKVPEVLARVGLESKQKNFPRELSGGEKQKTAIARALIHNPRLLIADEPTGNLDPRSAYEIINIFLNLNEEGVTTIMATHNKWVVDNINKRVVFLDKGRIVSDEQESGYDLSLLEAEFDGNTGGISFTEMHIEE